MGRQSAGLLLYRRTNGGAEVLLVHPGGPYWTRRDDGAWSIPKGEHGDDEDPLEVAFREFGEEIGRLPIAEVQPVALGEVRQAGGKRVRAWALEGDLDVSAIASNTFEIEWPPRSGRMRSFPEVDRAEWFDLETARRKVVRGQIAFLDRVSDLLGESLR